MVGAGRDPGPFISGFSAWLDESHAPVDTRARHIRDVSEFLAWYDVNHQDDVVMAATQFAEFGTHHQVSSMRLLVEWLAQS